MAIIICILCHKENTNSTNNYNMAVITIWTVSLINLEKKKHRLLSHFQVYLRDVSKDTWCVIEQLGVKSNPEYGCRHGMERKKSAREVCPSLLLNYWP